MKGGTVSIVVVVVVETKAEAKEPKVTDDKK